MAVLRGDKWPLIDWLIEMNKTKCSALKDNTGNQISIPYMIDSGDLINWRDSLEREWLEKDSIFQMTESSPDRILTLHHPRRHKVLVSCMSAQHLLASPSLSHSLHMSVSGVTLSLKRTQSEQNNYRNLFITKWTPEIY